MLKFGSKGDNSVVYKCTVRLLEDTEILECEYKAHHKGKYLLELVCKQLNLIEQDYLGLRYVDSMDQRHWLDMAKSIVKQIKDIDPVLFSFRVKFYPPDPFRLKEEITRYQIFLQLKRDLLHGRLYCTANESAQLGALILQGEVGDYDPEIHTGNYVADYKLLLKQTDQIEEKIMEIHQKQLKGQSASQSENIFLRVACQLDTYGIDPHPVKDHRGNQLYLGINYSGILTFQGSRKTHHFRWPDIQKINYEGKMFIIHLNYNDKKQTVGFKCSTGAACRHVWRCAIEQMLFFTLPTSSDAPSVVTGGGFFSWGTKFKYTGRTEREILEDMSAPTREEPTITRTSSLRRKASSVPATPSTPLQPHIGYSSLARSSHSDAGGSRMETSSSAGVLSNIDGINFPDNIALLETVSEDQEASAGKSRIQGMKDDFIDHFNDYYFRDSFEHSSSESQLVENSYKGYEGHPSHRSSRSQTPLSQGADSRLCVHHEPFYNTTAKSTQSSHKFSIVKVFIPSLIFVLIFIGFLTIVMLETDCELFGSLRNIPEMIYLRYHFYEPWKQYFRKKIVSLFS